MATIMTVCTGNICRSPAAEYLLRQYLGNTASIVSSGTHAMSGWAIPAPMLAPLLRAGIDASSHEGQQLTVELAQGADLILVMTSRHRDWVVSTSPRVLNRTFLLAEVAGAARERLTLEGDSVAERLSNVASAVASRRDRATGRDVADVPDPYGHDQATYDACFQMIEEDSREIAAWLLGEPPATAVQPGATPS